MNQIVNSFSLADDRFIPEMHLRQWGFRYIARGSFVKNKERIQKCKETGYSRHIYQNELDKACFQHDMAYRYFRNLTRKAASDKMLNDKALNVAKNLEYDESQRGLASLVYKSFDKETPGGTFKNENVSNKEWAEELYKPIIIKF